MTMEHGTKNAMIRALIVFDPERGIRIATEECTLMISVAAGSESFSEAFAMNRFAIHSNPFITSL